MILGGNLHVHEIFNGNSPQNHPNQGINGSFKTIYYDASEYHFNILKILLEILLKQATKQVAC